jgi:DNA-binding CsgD family transcriptional regulator
LPVLEATYLLEQPEADWLGGILDAAWSACPSALALTAYTFDVSDPTCFRPGPPVSRGEIPVPDISALMRTMPPEYVRSTWGTLQVEHTFKYGIPTEATDLAEGLKGFLLANGIGDGVTINAVDGAGRGTSLVLLFPKPTNLRTFMRPGWTRLAAHLATATRLRRLLTARGQEDGLEAVFSPSGKLVDARGPATANPAREALKTAVRQIEKARSGRSGQDGGPLETWRPLVTARWTLVDTFYLGGTRYLVAQENAPEVRDVQRLSRREREVVELAVAGHTNKLIAYALGISASTVGVLLHRASVKLRARSRSELMARYHSANKDVPN